MIPPFPFRKNNMIVFPSGKFDTFCTLSELKVCDPNTSNPHYNGKFVCWDFGKYN